MSGNRPNGETARRGGLVPFTGSSNGRSNNNNNNGSVPNSAGYPNINSNKSSNFGGNAIPEDVKASQRGNDQLWSNGSGAQTGAPTGAQGWSNGSSAKGSAPVWPENQQQDASTGPATPVNQSNNNNNNNKAAAAGGATGYIQGSQPGPNGPGPQQQQQQQPNRQRSTVQEGIPVNSSTNGQNNVGGGGGFAQGPQGAQRQGSGFITQGPQKGSVPKGDYVYYDGQGNQIQPGGSPQEPNGSGHWTGTGSERHFHHHYYYNNQQQQQPQQQPPVGYPYDKKMEQKKKRRPGATALAAALITCWACTCCCHAPCGF